MSRLPFELFLAFRYLRPKRTFVSVVTLISIIGVTLGVAVMIIVISVMTGFSLELQERLLGFNAHLKIKAADGYPITSYYALGELVRLNPEVRGVAPMIESQVLLTRNFDDGSSFQLGAKSRGVDTFLEQEVSEIPRSIVDGEYNLDGNGILVGSQIANRLRLRAGELVSVYTPRNFEQLANYVKQVQEDPELADRLELPVQEYEVKGIFDVGFYEFNEAYIITSLENSQDMNGFTQNGVHELQVMLHDPFKAEQVKSELYDKIGENYAILTWGDENSEILSALAVEKKMMFYILFFIMLVATFGITATLIAFVVQKTREIGILKSLGAGRLQVMGLFLGQSVLVGVIGVIFGFGLGILALHYRNDFLEFLRTATGFELFPAAIYQFSQLPAKVVPGDVLLICGSALFLCLLAGVIPAWNAGRLRPVEALRHE